eukprot:CAMPEP_0116887760 /NCGR_PEP_ID=MMETSP0463-20121206/22398_1 /TAXON_ID=181622 /ORGANISM="Strombidinopsis sp, Strain SopsisLIS2011" /LENGTH=115 /DNA_ID=CAMNT_0004551079 /DNA_START=208 /DNA_END=552 /DNA_ORIENTATION=+
MNDSHLIVAPPSDEIYDFHGKFVGVNPNDDSVTWETGLDLSNTLWSNTVLASPGHCLCMVVYTGNETRMQMNTESPRTKVGKLDQEINWLAKMLFLMMVCLSMIIVAVDGFKGQW